MSYTWSSSEFLWLFSASYVCNWSRLTSTVCWLGTVNHILDRFISLFFGKFWHMRNKICLASFNAFVWSSLLCVMWSSFLTLWDYFSKFNSCVWSFLLTSLDSLSKFLHCNVKFALNWHLGIILTNFLLL